MPEKPKNFEHHTAKSFWDCFESLPKDVQVLARKNFDLLKANPRHPSVRFKKLDELWSARVGDRNRALAMETDDGFLWFWIGRHSEYDKIT